MMKKMLMGCLVMAFCAIGCAKTDQKSGNETTEQSAADNVAADEGVMEGADVPPVFTLCVKGLPLFAPFNEGDLLNEGKALRETPAKYTKLIIGESVFDVLARVCEERGIQIESSWEPVFDSHYVEGIGHIYEFDCGLESGWVYKVNGWFPNYGCSSYTVANGDDIAWLYSCNGLGTDVGAPAYN